jgi:hypothetical protein
MRISRQQSSVQMIVKNGRRMWNIFNFLGSITTNVTRCRREIKSRITMAKAAFNKNSIHQQIALKFEEET